MAVIRRRENGNWQAIIRRKGHPPQRQTFGSKQDAKRWATQIENEIDRGVFVDRSPTEAVTVGELIDRYIAEVAPLKKSAANIRQCLLSLKPRFGAYSLAALQPRHIADYRDDRLAAGRAGGTVLKEMKMLSLVIDAAVKDWGYYVLSNPVQGVRTPSVAPGRDRRLTAEEERAILSACVSSRTPMLSAIVGLAIETGMRLGELLRLEWRDVDMARRTALLRDTKNGESRVIPLSGAACQVLARIPRHIAAPRVFWVWSRRDSFENAWRRAVERSGVTGLRFHDLRHEAVSRFFERGFNMMEVAAISGHKTLQMLKRYTHLKAETLAQRLA